jgi:hypothetical protein
MRKVPIVKEVRIEDLREPQRTADEQAFYEFAVRMEVDLDVDSIIADARATNHRRRAGALGHSVEAKGLEPSNLLTASQALYQLSYAPGTTGYVISPTCRTRKARSPVTLDSVGRRRLARTAGGAGRDPAVFGVPVPVP